MRTIQRDIVAGVVMAKDGKLLFGKKDPQSGGVYVDCWHTPGGGIEEGETKQQALVREIYEEMGLDVADATITLLDDTGGDSAERLLRDGERVLVKMRFYVYRVNLTVPSEAIRITPGDDIKSYTWVEPQELKKYKLTPPSITLFRKLGWL